MSPTDLMDDPPVPVATVHDDVDVAEMLSA